MQQCNIRAAKYDSKPDLGLETSLWLILLRDPIYARVTLRYIILHSSVEPLFLIIDLHVHHNAFGLPRNFDLIKL